MKEQIPSSKTIPFVIESRHKDKEAEPMYKLPFKPGDDIYILDEEYNYEIKVEKNGVAGIALMGDGEIKCVSKDGYVFSEGEENIYTSYAAAHMAQQKYRNMVAANYEAAFIAQQRDLNKK